MAAAFPLESCRVPIWRAIAALLQRSPLGVFGRRRLVKKLQNLPPNRALDRLSPRAQNSPTRHTPDAKPETRQRKYATGRYDAGRCLP